MTPYTFKGTKNFTLILLLFVIGISCKTELSKPDIKPEQPKPAFSTTINGTEYKLEEKDVSKIYYSSESDPIKAFLSVAKLNIAGDALTFFINDFKNGTINLTKKSGTSFYPGNPRDIKKLSLAGSAVGKTIPVPVQTYARFSSSGNIYYATSGTIEMLIVAKKATITWNLNFKDAAGKQFTSKGTFEVSDFTLNTKSKSEIEDPTPVALIPVIENISPSTAMAGDSVFITGVNFSAIASENHLKFNGADAPVISASDTGLVTLVPANGVTGALTLQVKAGEIITGPIFTYQSAPFITRLSKSQGLSGDSINVLGGNFSSILTDNVLRFNGTEAKIAAATDSTLTVVVPLGGQTGPLSIRVKNSATVYGPIFSYLSAATFRDFFPASGRSLDTVELIGYNFSTVLNENVVMFNSGKTAKIISASLSVLKLIVPEGALSGTVQISVRGIAGQSGSFKIDEPYPAVNWREVFSFSGDQNGNLIASNNAALLFAGGKNSTYLYYSSDAKNFTNVIASLPFNKGKDLDVNAIATIDKVFYLTTNLGIAKSANGSTWTKLNVDPSDPDLGFTGFCIHDSKTFTAFSGSAIYMSDDAGANWTKVIPEVNNLGYSANFSNSTKYLFAIDMSENTDSHDATNFYFSSRSTFNSAAKWQSFSKAGLYHFKDGFKDFLHTTTNSVYCAWSSLEKPGVANQRLYRSNTGSDWKIASSEPCYVVKTSSDLVAFGGTSFSLSTNDGTTYKKYALPIGYVATGIEIISDNDFYMICKNASGNSKLFRSK